MDGVALLQVGRGIRDTGNTARRAALGHHLTRALVFIERTDTGLTARSYDPTPHIARRIAAFPG